MIYFTSDWHFGHKSIIKFERFEFATIQEHDNYILKTLQNKLTPSDTLYFLGDLGNVSKEIENGIKNLQCGKKYIILGNHDRRSQQYYKNILGFDEVYNHPVYIQDRVVLSHIPIKVNNSTINIHGHLHGSKLNLPNYINVSFEVANKKLISYKTIANLLSNIPKETNDFMYEWFAPYYQITEDAKNHRTDLLLDENDMIIGFTQEGLNVGEIRAIPRFEINKKNLLNRIIKDENGEKWIVTDYSGYYVICSKGIENKKIHISNIRRILGIDKRI